MIEEGNGKRVDCDVHDWGVLDNKDGADQDIKYSLDIYIYIYNFRITS
jgi:hypothetical protein